MSSSKFCCWTSWLLCLALFDISISNIDSQYIDTFKNIDNDMVIFENSTIDKAILENININKAILKNIDVNIDRKYRYQYGDRMNLWKILKGGVISNAKIHCIFPSYWGYIAKTFRCWHIQIYNRASDQEWSKKKTWVDYSSVSSSVSTLALLPSTHGCFLTCNSGHVTKISDLWFKIGPATTNKLAQSLEDA